MRELNHDVPNNDGPSADFVMSVGFDDLSLLGARSKKPVRLKETVLIDS